MRAMCHIALVATRARPWYPWLTRLRRRVSGVDGLNRHLPWRAWCALGARDAIAVAWVVARRAGRPLRFVQIGSNDGVVHDPIHTVVRAYGWSGLLVEPLPELFAKLRANYEGVPNLRFENVAIGEADGTAILYTVAPAPGDPYWVDQLGSFEKSTVLSHGTALADVEGRLVEVPVASVRLPTLLARHAIDAIDLLHVDVEGYDYAVLRQIDFDATWAPHFVIYEAQHFDGATARSARRLLRGHGYRCIDIWPDVFAYRTSPEALPS